MAMAMGGGGSYSSDINVTPLVDVLLVLLIIFMVITPLSQMGYDVQIPKEAPTQVITQAEKQVILAINAQNCNITAPLMGKPLAIPCTVTLNSVPVALSDLPGKVSEVFKNRRGTDKILFLAAQESLNYEGVMQVLDVAKKGDDGLQIGIVSDEALATGAAPGAPTAPAPPTAP